MLDSKCSIYTNLSELEKQLLALLIGKLQRVEASPKLCS